MSVAAASAPDRAAAGRLVRMKALATGLLVAMALIFVAASVAERSWPAAAWVRAFAEAAMVGACADWFAVTALFRRPLGLPIPHTGVIPRNKDRIGAALGAFIAEEFLSEGVLSGCLRRIELAEWGGAWLSDPSNAERLAAQVAAVVPDMLAALPAGTLRRLLGTVALAAAKSAPAADLAGRALAFAWSGDRPQVVIERLAGWAQGVLAERQEVILKQVQAQTYRWIPAWADRIIARKLTDGVVQLLGELGDPFHPWRVAMDEAVADWIDRLARDEDLRARLEACKRELLADARLRTGLESVWSALEAQATASLTHDRSRLEAGVSRGLTMLGGWLRENAGLRVLLNDWSAATIRGVIAPRRFEIGRFIAEVVAGWDAEDVVDKLERQVGRDLQYIRINGTLVGGLVGLLIYALTGLTGLR